MNRYAIVRNSDSIVLNVIVKAPGATFDPPAGQTLVQLNDNEWCEIGMVYTP